MKHNYICMVGAIPIGVAGCIYKSNTMISSSVIGIIFHTYPNNKILKYTDLLFNVLLSCNASLYSNDIMILAIMSSICYLLNCFVFIPENKDNFAYNITHVFIVNIGGLYGYYLLYNHEPCVDFYFDCIHDNVNSTIM